jgi:hypothetical protein
MGIKTATSSLVGWKTDAGPPALASVVRRMFNDKAVGRLTARSSLFGKRK